VKQRNGRIAVMLINEDPDHPVRANLSIVGMKLESEGETWQYTRAATSLRRSRSSAGSLLVPPYSIVTLICKPTG
ncbi:MAG TPA: hypothetical protein VK934_09105, partial [Fimbriimonas sp.]|nr:hypothetical protein [Fimbriimonas sp.]